MGWAGKLKQYAGVARGAWGVGGDTPRVGPLHAIVGICDPCNHKCVFCIDHPPADRLPVLDSPRFGGTKPGVMSMDTFRGVVDDLVEMGTLRLDLVGSGEPLLNKSAAEMVEYAKAAGMDVILCSNGSKLTPEISSRFVAAGLDRINISMNAGTPETYTRNHVTESAENFVALKAKLAELVEIRERAGARYPSVRLSYVVSTENYFELEEMVRVAHEVGADETYFCHLAPHDNMRDLELSPMQLAEFSRALPGVEALANELGIQHNLETLDATPPLYLVSDEDTALGEGSTEASNAVPCYVGYYFTRVHGNGNVSPCLQAPGSIGRISADHRLSDIWKSASYDGFRSACRSLPVQGEELAGYECDACIFRTRNVSLHNKLHPLNPIDVGDRRQLFGVSDLLKFRKRDRAELPSSTSPTSSAPCSGRATPGAEARGSKEVGA